MKVAFLTTGSPNYFSKDYKIHEKSLDVLKTLQIEDLELENIDLEIQSGEDFAGAESQLMASDFIIVQCAGFTDGNLVPLFDALEKPMCIWAVNEPTKDEDIRLHSLVTQNLFASILKKNCSRDKRTYFLNGNAEEIKEELLNILLCEKLCMKLDGGRICQIGNEAYGFLNLRENEKLLKKKYGVDIDHIDVDKLIKTAKEFSDEEARMVVERVLSTCDMKDNISDALMRSARIYLALKKIASDGNYLGLAVSCWSELQDNYDLVPCAAFSWTVEFDDIPVACEGDICGVLSMIILKELSGTKPTLLDLTEHDEKDDAVLFWHCGFSPMSMAGEKCEIIKHPMLNRRLGEDKKLGASNNFYFKDSAATVLRVTGKDADIFCFESHTTDKLSRGFLGTRAWLTDFMTKDGKCSSKEIITSILENGVEHHYSLVLSKVLERAELFAKVKGIEILKIKN